MSDPSNFAAQELISIPFHGDTLEGVRMPDGRILVSIRRVCESLGLDFSRQLRKLEKQAWAGVVKMTAPGKDGVAQELAMLPHDQIPMWLATLNAGKVAVEFRSKLVLCQREACQVLARHSLGEEEVPDLAETPTEALRRSLRQELVALDRLVEQERATRQIQREQEAIRMDQLPTG
jgi:hypothetical protein